MCQPPLLLHIPPAGIKDIVAVEQTAFLIDGDQPVRVSVKGKADVIAALAHHALQAFRMSGSAVCIDVHAIWLAMDDIHLRTHRPQGLRSGRRRAAVGQIEGDPHPVQVHVHDAHEPFLIDLQPLAPADHAAHVIVQRRRHVDLAVDIVLDLCFDLWIHLAAFAVEELDAVVMIRIMRRADHDAAVE